MCSDEKLQLAKEDKAFVFRKKSFYISTGIIILTLFAGVIFAFADVKLQARTNCTDIQSNITDIKTNGGRITTIEENMEGIEEIRFNLKNLCIKQGVKYIEGAE